MDKNEHTIIGANGYNGQRLIPVLLEEGHQLYCCVRNRQRFESEHRHKKMTVIEIDFLDNTDTIVFQNEIDAAFYLVHSMNTQNDFAGPPSGAGVLSCALLLLIFNPATFQYGKLVTCRHWKPNHKTHASFQRLLTFRSTNALPCLLS